MTHSLRAHLNELAGFGISALGVITANQEQVEWWLRCGASLIAIIAGAATIYSVLKKNKPSL